MLLIFIYKYICGDRSNNQMHYLYEDSKLRKEEEKGGKPAIYTRLVSGD
jgi:hypothetical protein